MINMENLKQPFIVYYFIGCNKFTLSEALNQDIDVLNSIVDLIENNKKYDDLEYVKRLSLIINLDNFYVKYGFDKISINKLDEKKYSKILNLIRKKFNVYILKYYLVRYLNEVESIFMCFGKNGVFSEDKIDDAKNIQKIRIRCSNVTDGLEYDVYEGKYFYL